MDAVILAAGKGTRLLPLTETMPKVLVPVAGRGTLLRNLEILPAAVDRVIIVVGYLHERIREAVGSEAPGHRPVIYLNQEPLDGTGGALRQAESLLRGERFLVLYGDDLYAREDLERLCREERALLVRPVTVAPEETRSTLDAWDVEAGRVTRLKRLQPGESGYGNLGAYVLGREWFAAPPVLVPGKTDEWSIPDAIPMLLERHPHQAIEASFWYPCGTFEEIQHAESALRSHPK